MEKLLSNREEHYVHLEINNDIETFMSTFDDDFHAFLNMVGGLQGLLSKCTVFSFDERQKNIMYLTEKEQEYREHKRKIAKSLEIEPPACEDALFVETDLIKDLKNTSKGGTASSSCRQDDNKHTNNIPDVFKNTIKGGSAANSSKIEINEVPNADLSDGYEEEDENDEDDGKPLCSVNFGVQIDMPNVEIDNLKLMNLKLMDRVKEMREENDRLAKGRESNEQELKQTLRQLHNEIAEYKKSNEV